MMTPSPLHPFTPSPRLALIVLLALAVAPYFIGLGASSLWDSNEAFYAGTPREMIESGDYLNPSFNYRPRFNKPPLSYWIVAGSYKIFGVSEWAERLPIALGALVLIGAAFMLGRVIFSPGAGLLAAIAMAAAPRFLMFSRRIMIDVYVAMFMGLTLLFFALAEKRPEKRRLYLILMYVSVGLGILTKGPVAAMLPAAAFLIYLWMVRDLGRIRRMLLPAGVLIVAAIVLPWYVAVYWQHGWHYIATFLLKDNLSRYTEPVWGPRRGVLFYFPVLLGDMFPWSLVLLADGGLRIFRPVRGGSDKGANTWLLLWIWIAVIVVFYSLSRNKEDLYILPVYVAAAALVGNLLTRFITEIRNPQSAIRNLTLRWTMAVIALTFVFIGAGILYLFGKADSLYHLAGARATGFIILAGGLLVTATALWKKDFFSVAGTGLTVIAVNWVFVLWTLPDFERYKPARALCEMISARAGPEALVGYYRFASPSMTFYLRRPIFEYYDPQEIAGALASGREVYCLTEIKDYEALRRSQTAPIYILASRPVFQVKLRSILDRTELPQVVLISNKDGTVSSE